MKIFFSMSAHSQQVHLPFDMAVEHVSTPFFSLSLSFPLFCFFFYFFVKIFSSLSVQQIVQFMYVVCISVLVTFDT